MNYTKRQLNELKHQAFETFKNQFSKENFEKMFAGGISQVIIVEITNNDLSKKYAILQQETQVNTGSYSNMKDYKVIAVVNKQTKCLTVK